MYVYIYIYTYIHTYVYTHIHTSVGIRGMRVARSEVVVVRSDGSCEVRSGSRGRDCISQSGGEMARFREPTRQRAREASQAGSQLGCRPDRFSAHLNGVPLTQRRQLGATKGYCLEHTV